MSRVGFVIGCAAIFASVFLHSCESYCAGAAPYELTQAYAGCR